MNIFYPFQISCLINAAAALFIGVFVLGKNPKKIVNRLFFFLNFAIFIWSIGLFVEITSVNKYLALSVAKIFHLAVFFIPIFYLHLILSIFNFHRKYKIFLYFGYFLAFSFSFLNFSDLMINDVIPIPELFVNYFIKPGVLYLFFIFTFLIFPLIGNIIIAVHFRKLTPYAKNQYKYIVIASIWGFLGGSTTYLPAYNIKLYPYANFLFALYPLIIAYAILKYRLMDITIAIQKTTLIALGVLLPTAGLIIAVNLLQPFLVAQFGSSWWLVPSGLTVLWTVAVLGVIKKIVKLKDEELNKAKYVYRQQLKLHLARLTQAHSGRELADYVVREVSTLARLDYCSIALKKEVEIMQEGIPKKIGTYEITQVADRTHQHFRKKLLGKTLSEDSALIQYLKKELSLEKGYLGYLMAQDPQKRNTYSEMLKEMEELNAEVIFASLSAEQLVGFLALGKKLDGTMYSEEDFALFRLLCSQAAKPIAELIAREDNIRLILASCRSNLAALEERDQYTRSHTSRVKEICFLLAQDSALRTQLGKISDGIWGLGVAAELHDLGKIGIGDEILNKPAELNCEEREEIKKHPQKALTIIGDLAVWLKEDIIRGILEHQENYNGTGYPKGLKANEIHLYARIIHVADALDAMTSDRPYRKALPLEVAIEEIRKNRQIQFDPEIVDCLLQLYQDGHIKNIFPTLIERC
ncbi:MAG: HD domain-containing protein [Candidatus Omnitrophica bacterium]|nr:HD domain-containing protein [Candidatus Omnitrophota bacterium]